ncbi:hypothetical protein [Kribbella sp. NPDC049584]|uniref:hypothetical protein n=1 Tax=Kribbella sp. NPDC049584 TaxID=3154833 RepID=UPI0034156D7A
MTMSDVPNDRRYDTDLDSAAGNSALDDRRMPDNDQLPDDRMAEDRMAGDRMTDDRMTDDRMAGDRMTEDRLAGDRVADGGLADDHRADDRVADRTESGMTAAPAADEPLVAEDAVVDYRARWDVIQQGFVDDPRKAVTEADSLVDDVLKNLADSFDRQRQGLEQQWSGGEPSTEDLRSALQRYRAFFQRLLTL